MNSVSAILRVLKIFALIASSGQRRAAELYELFSTDVSYGESSLYINLGYWDGATTYDAACERLAQRLAEAAAFAPGDEILDVGFGFGDQDLYWAREFAPCKIVGLNVTASQIETARRRVADEGLSDVIDLRLGSATAMPCLDASFDRVTALESAFHFVTREDFLREGFRVLRPGGRLAVADIIARDDGRLTPRHAIALSMACRTWQFPRENYYDASVYRQKLERAGFESITVRSIRDQVFAPVAEYLRRRVDEPQIVDRLHPLQRWAHKQLIPRERFFDPFDYVLVTADKGTGERWQRRP